VRLDHLLRGGDPRSLGGAGEAVELVLNDPDRLPELLDCLAEDDAVVRMRAGDALEKVARRQPDLIPPYLDRLLAEPAGLDQPSVQWHLAQIVGEVPLTDDQHRRAVQLLRRYLEHGTDWIVLTSAMTSATTLALDDTTLRGWLVPALRHRVGDPRPAVAKRALRQLARLGEAG
jgi:HEAT repeat protein